MIDLLVGCPVMDRAWVLPAWFEHVRKACARADVEPAFLFGGPPKDFETWYTISRQTHIGGERLFSLSTDEVPRSDVREWGPQRYAHMAVLRNELLRYVRWIAPRFFLSVDSDILLHPEAVANLIESAARFDAVGGRCYMMAMGDRCPSYAMLTRDGNIRREDAEGVFRVDVIMALKLMSPKAYAVDYRGQHHGEDIGWSQGCKEAGVKLGWDGRCISKHILEPRMLNEVDKRVGW